MSPAVLDQLVDAGLVTSSVDPHLSDKGRDWLRNLEDLEQHEVQLDGAADLVLSCSGLFR